MSDRKEEKEPLSPEEGSVAESSSVGSEQDSDEYSAEDYPPVEGQAWRRTDNVDPVVINDGSESDKVDEQEEEELGETDDSALKALKGANAALERISDHKHLDWPEKADLCIELYQKYAESDHFSELAKNEQDDLTAKYQNIVLNRLLLHKEQISGFSMMNADALTEGQTEKIAQFNVDIREHRAMLEQIATEQPGLQNEVEDLLKFSHDVAGPKELEVHALTDSTLRPLADLQGNIMRLTGLINITEAHITSGLSQSGTNVTALRGQLHTLEQNRAAQIIDFVEEYESIKDKLSAEYSEDYPHVISYLENINTERRVELREIYEDLKERYESLGPDPDPSALMEFNEQFAKYKAVVDYISDPAEQKLIEDMVENRYSFLVEDFRNIAATKPNDSPLKEIVATWDVIRNEGDTSVLLYEANPGRLYAARARLFDQYNELMGKPDYKQLPLHLREFIKEDQKNCVRYLKEAPIDDLIKQQNDLTFLLHRREEMLEKHRKNPAAWSNTEDQPLLDKLNSSIPKALSEFNAAFANNKEFINSVIETAPESSTLRSMMTQMVAFHDYVSFPRELHHPYITDTTLDNQEESPEKLVAQIDQINDLLMERDQLSAAYGKAYQKEQEAVNPQKQEEARIEREKIGSRLSNCELNLYSEAGKFNRDYAESAHLDAVPVHIQMHLQAYNEKMQDIRDKLDPEMQARFAIVEEQTHAEYSKLTALNANDERLRTLIDKKNNEHERLSRATPKPPANVLAKSKKELDELRVELAENNRELTAASEKYLQGLQSAEVNLGMQSGDMKKFLSAYQSGAIDQLGGSKAHNMLALQAQSNTLRDEAHATRVQQSRALQTAARQTQLARATEVKAGSLGRGLGQAGGAAVGAIVGGLAFGFIGAAIGAYVGAKLGAKIADKIAAAHAVSKMNKQEVAQLGMSAVQVGQRTDTGLTTGHSPTAQQRSGMQATTNSAHSTVSNGGAQLAALHQGVTPLTPIQKLEVTCDRLALLQKEIVRLRQQIDDCKDNPGVRDGLIKRCAAKIEEYKDIHSPYIAARKGEQTFKSTTRDKDYMDRFMQLAENTSAGRQVSPDLKTKFSNATSFHATITVNNYLPAPIVSTPAPLSGPQTTVAVTPGPIAVTSTSVPKLPRF